MLPSSAIAMLIFGCIVFYGGLGWCIWIAIKKSREEKEKEGKEDDD